MTDEELTMHFYQAVKARFGRGIHCPTCGNLETWGVPYGQPQGKLQLVCGCCGHILEYNRELVDSLLRDVSTGQKEQGNG